MDWGLFYFQDVEPSVLFIRDFLAKQTVPFDVSPFCFSRTIFCGRRQTS